MKNDHIVWVAGSGRIVGGLDSGQCGGGGGDVGSILSIHDGVGVEIQFGRRIKVFLSCGTQRSGGGKDAVNSGFVSSSENQRGGHVGGKKIVVEDIGISAEGDALGRSANFIRDEEIPLVQVGGACNRKAGSVALAKIVGDFAPDGVDHPDAREGVEFGLVVDQRGTSTGFQQDAICVVVTKIIEAGGLGSGGKVDPSRGCGL